MQGARSMEKPMSLRSVSLRSVSLRSVFAAIVVLPLIAAPAAAEWRDGVRGNDSGGIIPWSPEIADVYRDIAAGFCAHFDKVSAITSVHDTYGDYVGFRCYFPRGYDPRKGAFAAPVRALD
jgi:hypothetical protein